MGRPDLKVNLTLPELSLARAAQEALSATTLDEVRAIAERIRRA